MKSIDICQKTNQTGHVLTLLCQRTMWIFLKLNFETYPEVDSTRQAKITRSTRKQKPIYAEKITLSKITKIL